MTAPLPTNDAHEVEDGEMKCIGVQTEPKRLSVHDFVNDDEALHHYTGMESYLKFMFFFSIVWEHVFMTL